MTFVDPLISQALKLPQEVMFPSTQATLTIQGESEAKPCHIIEGLVVTPLDEQPKITLPPAIMQNKIPDAWDQVPSRREVENIPGYREYAKHFPEKKTHLPTIVLIG